MIVTTDKKSFLTLFENAFEGALLLSEERVLACNPAAEKILGLQADALVGKQLEELFETGQITSGECRFKDKLLELRRAPSLVLFIDKTRQQERQKELESTLITLDTITRAGTDFILSKDKENLEELFAELLAGLEAVCGAECGVIAALPLYHGTLVSSCETLEELSPFLEQAAAQKTPLIEETRLTIPLLSRGTVLGVLFLKRKEGAFTHDQIRLMLPVIQMAILFIEGRQQELERRESELLLEKARDEALQASRAKSAFLANMSHEIRTPLNAVMGMTELLLNSELTEAQQNLAEKTYSSAEILLHILNDILDISKIEAGQMVLEKLPFSLKKIFEEVQDLLAFKAAHKGLALSFSRPEEIDSLLGDPTRLRQILANLVGNAVKFTEKGAIAVSVVEKPKGTLLFSVQDSGIGIKKERQEQIFEVFTQEDSSTTRKFGGTGLGLSICKQLVEAMGGTIGLQSAEGAGSTFTFTLPFRKP